MSYVKKFSLGDIRIDTPYKHFIHELPLLSFGDVLHTINLSLIFQSKTSENAYKISQGYKFNLLKRIKLSSGGTPEYFEDGHGTLTPLISCGERFTFDDDSQRIIRKLGNTFVLENPDLSTESYDNYGRITEIYDKYGHAQPYLEYYYAYGRLETITYRDSKILKFNYHPTLEMVSSIDYIYEDEVQCSLNFSYPGNANVTINHYSGVNYYITYYPGDFKIYSSDSETGTEFNRIVCVSSDNGYKVEKFIKTQKVDSITYDFTASQDEDKYIFLDVTDKNGIKTRAQLANDKVAYSYEIFDNMFEEDEDNETQTYIGKVTHHNNSNSIGYQAFADGVKLLCRTNPTFTSTNHFVHIGNINGPLMLSGWLKSINSVSECDINFYNNDAYMGSVKISNLAEGEWTYFLIPTPIDQFDNLSVTTSVLDNRLLACDFRLIYPSTVNPETGGGTHITRCVDVLIKENASDDEDDQYFELKDTDAYRFYNGDTLIEHRLSTRDIMKYKINRQLSLYKEIYYDDCRGVIVTNNALSYNTLNGENSKISIDTLALGKKIYKDGKIYITKFNYYPSENAFISETIVDGNSYTKEVYNAYLDVVESLNEDVEVVYTRNEYGLIREQTTSANGMESITISASYDEDCTKLERTTDEFGSITQYETDAIWGVITETTYADGMIVKDDYDGDKRTLLLKSFKKGNEIKQHTFGYADGKLTSISDGGITYGFSHSLNSAGASVSTVLKSGNSIENHTVSNDNKDATSKYPSNTNPLVTVKQHYDAYGRLVEVEDVLENTYDIAPIRNGDITYTRKGKDNSGGKLAVTVDNLTGTETRYGYTQGKLTHVGEFNSSGDMLREERFEFDEKNRLAVDHFTYDAANSKSVRSEISYPSGADNRISSYSFKVNGNEKAQTANEYDAYKRIKQKTYTVGGKSFSKKINYTKTRPTSVEDKCGTTNIANTAYEYDSMGRMLKEKDGAGNVLKSYTYDTYGQLTKEVNNVLDKTFDYVYNEIGNIESVTKNGVTTQFGYDTDYPDRLTSYGNKAITYNANGGVSSYDGWSYSWSKRRLTGISMTSTARLITPSLSPSKSYSFTYNAFGQRTGKSYAYFWPDGAIVSVQTGETTYYNKQFKYDASGRLLAEIVNETQYGVGDISKSLKYLYDESGMIGVQYTNGANTSTYYYLRNLQGDVIGIYNTSGTKVVGYTYDAWGNCTIDSSTTDYTLAHDNPIRYRGYYYDEDTGLYYLNSRYYSPEWRRFISPDDTAYLDSETPNGLNLYCYCGNDPVNYCDPSGHWIETVFDLFSLGASVVEVVIDPYNPWNWAGLIGDAVDLLPIVTGIGEGVRAAKIVKYTDDVIDSSYDTIKFVKAVDYADNFADGGKMLNKFDHVDDYYKFTVSNHVDGTKLHKLFMDNGDVILNTKFRYDGLDPVTNTLFELKPYNKRNVRKGVKQIIQYNNAMGGGYHMIIVLY